MTTTTKKMQNFTEKSRNGCYSKFSRIFAFTCTIFTVLFVWTRNHEISIDMLD